MHTRTVRSVACAGVVIAAALLGSASEEPARAEVGFPWLTGTWRMEEGDTVCDEIWGEPRGGSQFGAFRLTRGQTTGFLEIFMIERNGDDVYLKLRHFSRGLEPWKDEAAGPTTWRLVSSKEREAVFESASSRLTYRRADEHTLVARLQPLPAKEQEANVFTFRLVRPRDGR